MTIKVVSLAANESIALYWLQKEENEHNQEVEFGLARHRLGDNWRHQLTGACSLLRRSSVYWWGQLGLQCEQSLRQLIYLELCAATQLALLRNSGPALASAHHRRSFFIAYADVFAGTNLD
jgi:hypothetical protein